MTRQIRSDVEHRVLKAYACGSDLRTIAGQLCVREGSVSAIVMDVAGLNRSYARTLVTEWERTGGQPAPLRRAAAPVRTPPPARPVPVAPPQPVPEPVPEPVVAPAPEPVPAAATDPVGAWPGWLCEPFGRRYRDNGPHGAPKRCGCKPVPIVVGGAS